MIAAEPVAPLKFERDSELRRLLQPAGARRHPGKLHLGFLAWLLDRYTKPGDVLLDPMAGSGSLVLAALPQWGCHLVLNELEPNWCAWIAATWEQMHRLAVDAPKTEMLLLCGSARDLSERLRGAADGLVCSPPWFNSVGPLIVGDTHYNKDRQFAERAAGMHKNFGADAAVFSPAWENSVGPLNLGDAQGSIGQQIAANRLGLFRDFGADVIIGSPPYANALTSNNGGGGPALHRLAGAGSSTNILRGWSYDGVITSPPYVNALAQQDRDFAPEKMAGCNPATAAALRTICAGYDGALLSPPYWDALSPQRHSDDYHPERQQGHGRGEDGDEHIRDMRRGYDPTAKGRREANPEQIGNTSGRRYAEMMSDVYGECHKLLKPGGVMIVVIKNIVRKKKEVDLVGQAVEMCEGLGFAHETTHWREVQTGVFHHIRKKHDPDALVIDREAAIVLRRSA